MIRAQGLINFPALDILQCMYCQDFQRQWDQNLESSNVVHKHQSNLLVVTKKTDRTMIWPEQDFVFGVLLNKEGDGSIQQVMKMMNKGCVEVPLSGIYLQADPHDRNKTRVTIIHEMGLKENSMPKEVLK